MNVDGLPFSPIWHGDSFDNTQIPFHHGENIYPGGSPPPPSESTDVAIVGGGLSGLASAYLLRERRPVLFDLQPRFGGTSMGEIWAGTRYSLGGAYFITPDEGSDLESLYQELGLDRRYRLSGGEDDPAPEPVEFNGMIDDAVLDGSRFSGETREAFVQYGALVRSYAENYPEIPLPDPEANDNSWILELDRVSLRDHVARSLTVPIPHELAAAVQAYCYSSFGAGWEELSAAAGWNFIAAEEYGRWVLPGGNAGLTESLWSRIAALEDRSECPPVLLRAGCRVVEVRVVGPDKVLVVYRDSMGEFRSLEARQVIMACPKHVARHVLNFAELDPQRDLDVRSIQRAAYVVANVLLDSPVERDFYDMFLLGDGVYPQSSDEAEPFSRVTDVVSGHYARRSPNGRSVLTLYWPLPFPHGRFSLIDDNGWSDYAGRLSQGVRDILRLLDVPAHAVRQVRMARWGHAMPIASPNLIADGILDRIRRPFMDHVFFVNQDNWALPAVETCLLEALTMAALV